MNGALAIVIAFGAVLIIALLGLLGEMFLLRNTAAAKRFPRSYAASHFILILVCLFCFSIILFAIVKMISITPVLFP